MLCIYFRKPLPNLQQTLIRYFVIANVLSDKEHKGMLLLYSPFFSGLPLRLPLPTKLFLPCSPARQRI